MWPGGRRRAAGPGDHRHAGARRARRRCASSGPRPRRRIRGRRPYPAPRATGMIRVLLCDAPGLVRSGFRMILAARDDLEVVGEAEDGVQAIALARKLDPDVILMDVRMPELN